MEILLSVQNLEKHFGAKTLFNALSFSVHAKDKIGMVGPNGAGKSTLLKMIYDLEPFTTGHIAKRSGLKMAYVPQEESFPKKSIFLILMELKDPLVEDYIFEMMVHQMIEKCGFLNPDQEANSLSGGYQKRLSFAKAWIQNPDLILFDEPTNHLDLDTLFWIEETINQLSCAMIIISHDRCFLENTCNKIIEINQKFPKGCFIVDGTYHEYLIRKEAFFEANQQLEQHLKSKLKKEIEWLRTSPKARTTKAVSRIKDAHALQRQFSSVKKQNKSLQLELGFESSERETKKLITIKNLTKSFQGRVLFKGLDLNISPSTRLGILGFNGSGKTTLFKIINQELPQEMGTIKYADDLKIVYFKQNREIFQKVDTLRNVLSPHSDFVNFMGKPTHINGFCKAIGFAPEDLDMPCFKFSGGEKARALIGKLMLEKADVLLLDEPTNDLDMETLDIFLDVLKNYDGAILIISHDRFFLDAICDEMIGIGLEETPKFYSNFEAFQEEAIEKKETKKLIKTVIEKPIRPSFQQEKKRLQVVLNKITQLEKEIKELSDSLVGNPDSKTFNLTCETLGKKQKELESFMNEWETLEMKIHQE